ncbi:MAG: hypothetical protein ABIL09_19170 [Gemmatimonadota bacterium]
MRRALYLAGGLAAALALFVAFYQETYVKPGYLYIGDRGAESDTVLVNCTQYEARLGTAVHDGLSWHLAPVGYRETHEGCEAILLDHELAARYAHLPMAEPVPAPAAEPDTWGVRAWVLADVPDSAAGQVRPVWRHRWSEAAGAAAALPQ